MRPPTRIQSTILAVFFFFAILWMPSTAMAGMRWHGSGGWGPGSSYSRMYNPATVETVRGEVVKILKFVPERGMHYGIHLRLKTDKGIIDVHLGPAWYIMNQDVKIAPKDQIEVTGSRITFGGKAAIVASEIKKGDETLTLRDHDGYPMWSGWKRH